MQVYLCRMQRFICIEEELNCAVDVGVTGLKLDV